MAVGPEENVISFLEYFSRINSVVSGPLTISSHISEGYRIPFLDGLFDIMSMLLLHALSWITDFSPNVSKNRFTGMGMQAATDDA